MSRSLCSKELYCTFLQVTSQRYSAVSLSDVAPYELSHDSITRWLSSAKCQPHEIWKAASGHVLGTKGVIIADDSVLSKSRSYKIELVRQQYSGAEHGVTHGIGMLNFLWADKSGDEYWESHTWADRSFGKEALGDWSLSPRVKADLWSGALYGSHESSAEKSFDVIGIELDQASRRTKADLYEFLFTAVECHQRCYCSSNEVRDVYHLIQSA